MALSTTQYGYIIDPMVPFTDGKGNTIKDGFVRVFVAGSSTPVITYRNFDGAANQDLIELDNSGRTKTSVIGSKGLTYKVCVYDQLHSQESPILTVDKVSVIGANITVGAGATVVTGLDGLRTKPDGFVDASVVGTDGYVALDHTLVTDDLDTDAKATAVENDRYVPLLNNDVNDPDSKITLKRLRQWTNRPTQVVITPSDFIGTGLSNNEWAAAVDAMEDNKTAVVKWTESGATRVAFSSRYEAGVGLVFVAVYGGYVADYVVAATSGAHTVTKNVYDNIDEVHTLPEAADFNNDDGVLVDGATGGPRFMLWHTLANKVLGFIKSLSTTITAFRTGDVIPVDGPSGTAKMSKDDLLRVTAENALGSIHSLSDTATEADLVAGNYIALDGEGGTKRLPANLLGGGGGEGNGIVYINPSTTQNEVADIVSSGKLPVMQVVAGQGYNYFYPSWIGSGLTFVHIGRYGVVVKMWDNQVSGWTDVAGYDTTLSSDSTNAVQNATLYAVIGNIETLLAAL